MQSTQHINLGPYEAYIQKYGADENVFTPLQSTHYVILGPCAAHEGLLRLEHVSPAACVRMLASAHTASICRNYDEHLLCMHECMFVLLTIWLLVSAHRVFIHRSHGRAPALRVCMCARLSLLNIQNLRRAAHVFTYFLSWASFSQNSLHAYIYTHTSHVHMACIRITYLTQTHFYTYLFAHTPHFGKCFMYITYLSLQDHQSITLVEIGATATITLVKIGATATIIEYINTVFEDKKL